ncbi:MAG: S8 family peptidase [bacterium]|nr:S8 family peptidase [Candidatus Kapabacteria bacterium]
MKISPSIVFAAVAIAGISVAGCSDAISPDAPTHDEPSAMLKTAAASARIPGSYIVVLKDNVADPSRVANEMRQLNGLGDGFTYTHAVKGFSTTIPAGRLDEILRDPRVAYVEEDQIMRATAQTLPWGVSATGADSSSALSGDGTGSVTNVRIYIIDTGIQTNHPDLNVVGGINYTTSNRNKYLDENGHGTHCAGIAAARDNSSYVVGMCPGAPLYSVRVLNRSGSGTTSGVIAGVDWVRGQKNANPTVPMVANMSLGGGVSTLLDQAVANCISAGVVVCVAAGNSGVDAANSSPAREASAITVGAHASNQTLASWSNYGSVVDILAPGVSILSTYKGTTTATISGTSMAAPHVAGAAALYLSANTTASPATVSSALVGSAQGWITHSRASTTNLTLRVTGY